MYGNDSALFHGGDDNELDGAFMKCGTLYPFQNSTPVLSPNTLLSVMERRLAGSSLLLLCSILQSLYYLTFIVLCKWRMWTRHTFFLWLISLSVSNCSNLIMYSFGFSLTILNFPNCVTVWNLWAGHVYNFFFAVSYAHFPAMALIRLLAVWKPTRTHGWFTLNRSLAMITGLWLSNAVHVLVLLLFRENWFYFNPLAIGWDASDPQSFSRFFTWYWLMYEVTCVGVSIPAYCFCYMKLRAMQQKRAITFGRGGARKSDSSTNNNHSNNVCAGGCQQLKAQQQALRDTPANLRKAERLRTAEKNLLLIGFALSAIMALDIILWRTSILLFNGTKYAALLVTMVEIIMYGVDAVIILTLSKEVRSKVRKLLSSGSYGATTSF